MQGYYIFVGIYLLMSYCSGDHELKYKLRYLHSEQNESNTTKLVCYYALPNPAPSTPVLPSELNATLCTHIIYIPTSLDSDGKAAVVDSSHPVFFRNTIPLLRKLNPSITILISNSGGQPANFPVVLGSKYNRTRFVQSISPFLRQYGFDGFDLDFEFPGWNGLPVGQIHNFSLLLQEIHEGFVEESKQSGKPRLILSAATAANFMMMMKIYEFDYLAKYLDLVNLMGYDFNGFSYINPLTGYNSPLHPESYDIKFFRNKNLAWIANEYVKQGIPKSKMMVGIPTYCHAYKLLSSHIHGIRAPSIGRGECEFGGYTCACQALKNATRVWDDAAKVPYLYYGDQWVSYDDIQSTTEKVKWITENNFGGVMVWCMNADDVHGICDGKTKFPLISQMHNIIFKKGNR